MNKDTKSGIEKARETVKAIKGELNIEQKTSEMEMIKSNAELAKLYNENSQVGAENLQGMLPQLKIHSTGKSTTNELIDGKKPNDGWLFYRPTQEQFQTVECHVLTISKGYYADGIKKPDGTIPKVFNQILGGVILEDKDIKPFIMYFTGVKLQNLWEFGKEVNKYTHAKPVSIPMFALTVKVSTETVKHTYGESWVAKLEVVKNEDGSPRLVTDIGEFKYLQDSVSTIKDTIDSLIASKAVEEESVDAIPSVDVSTEETDEVDQIPF